MKREAIVVSGWLHYLNMKVTAYRRHAKHTKKGTP